MAVTQFFRRILPALLMASSVTLLSAGVFNWAPPAVIGEGAYASATPDSGDPVLDMTPLPTHTLPPTPEATDIPIPTGGAIFTGPPYDYPVPTWPAPTPSDTPSATTPDPTRIPTSTGDALPTRIVIPSLGIDLPIVRGNTDYPLCDVAMYLDGFANPGQPGTTYIYAHARTGMFLPLLDESQIDNGAGMIGALVKVYSADDKLHLYQINIVKRHATDLSLAYDLAPGEHRLVMQTSEGPHGTIPKLQVAAKPIGVFEATDAESNPTPHPRACG